MKLLILIVLLELWLQTINYFARVKYHHYFQEQNALWRWFDKHGLTCLAIFLHPIFVVGIGIAFYSNSIMMGFVVGALFINALTDTLTLSKVLPCIKMKCTQLDIRRMCLNCSKREKYYDDFGEKLIQKKYIRILAWLFSIFALLVGCMTLATFWLLMSSIILHGHLGKFMIAIGFLPAIVGCSLFSVFCIYLVIYGFHNIQKLRKK